jgi:hypothetical protein
MSQLTPDDLMSLEEYARQRPEFRARVLEHKQHRKVQIGPNATLYFEDRLTMQYQVQEMLRTERIFEPEGIADELGAYNPLIPDGSNWKATFMLEYTDIEERRVALGRLLGVEDRVWVRVEGHDRVWAVADEDMERDTEEKTSSVHFLRFELEPPMIDALKRGGALSIGIEHEHLNESLSPVPPDIRESLLADLR